MMEFTLSRVCMSVCGLILLSVVMIPVTGMFEDSSDSDVQDLADNTGRLLETFERSGADVMFLEMKDILPDHSYSLRMENGMIIITEKGKEFRTSIPWNVDTSAYQYEDVIEIRKISDGISVRRL
jgi:hypothetical protein